MASDAVRVRISPAVARSVAEPARPRPSRQALDAGKITSILSSLASGDEVKRRRRRATATEDRAFLPRLRHR